MESELFVRRYEPGDEESILDLLGKAFGKWPHFDIQCTPREYWAWKYRDNLRGTNLITICTSHERIIGISHHIPVRMKLHDKVYRCGFSGDNAVHEGFRNMGVSNRMYAYSWRYLGPEAGIPFIYWSAENPYVIKLSMERFRTLPFRLKHLIMIKDVAAHLRHYRRSAGPGWFARFGLSVERLRGRAKIVFHPVKAFGEMKSSHVIEFDERIDRLCEKASEHSRFMVVRSKTYLNWRYVDPRAGGYKIKQVEADDEILGYVVLRVERSDPAYPQGYIVDLLTAHGEEGVADCLIADSIRYFETTGVNIIHSLIVRGHPNERLYYRHGFIDRRRAPMVFYRHDKNSDVQDKLAMIRSADPGRLHFSYGDLDNI